MVFYNSFIGNGNYILYNFSAVLFIWLQLINKGGAYA